MMMMMMITRWNPQGKASDGVVLYLKNKYKVTVIATNNNIEQILTFMANKISITIGVVYHQWNINYFITSLIRLATSFQLNMKLYVALVIL